LDNFQIWKEPKAKGWVWISVQQLVKRYKVSGTMDRKKGPGRPITATTVENADLVESLIVLKKNLILIKVPVTLDL